MATMAISEDDLLAAHRTLYPALAHCTYLNYGARGVLPVSAREAILNSLDTLQSVGPASRAARAWIEHETAATRTRLGELIGAPSQRMAIVDSVSTACALAIWGIAWCAGDHAVLCESEPPGTWAALRQAAQRFGLTLSSFSMSAEAGGGSWQDRLLEALRPSTRLVIVSHVDWVSGVQCDLLELLAVVRRGPCPRARMLIDGAQAVGVVPVDVLALGVDLYAFGGQKWLGGPDGIAALYVSENARADVEPTLAGWRAVEPTEDGLDLRFTEDARRYESGTSAYALFAGFRQAIATQESFASLALRSSRILQINNRLRSKLRTLSSDHLRGSLRILGQDASSGITTFTIENANPAQWVRSLERTHCAGFAFSIVNVVIPLLAS